LWRTCQLGEEPPKHWEEVVIPWSQAKKLKASWQDLRWHLRILDKYLRGKLLKDIKAEDVDRIKAEREAEGAAPATANRTLEVMRSVLRMALKRQWLKMLPPIEFLDEPDGRIRWITPEEADRLIHELSQSKRTTPLAEMVRFSLATGLRESNVTGLEWSRVDLERRVMWVESYQSKNGESFNLPLSAEAILVLRRLQGMHPRWVFTYYGRNVDRGNTKAFKAALKTCRDPQLPLARPATYLGLLARSEWNAFTCPATTRGMENACDGDAVCTPRGEPPRRICRQPPEASGRCWQRIGKVGN